MENRRCAMLGVSILNHEKGTEQTRFTQSMIGAAFSCCLLVECIQHTSSQNSKPEIPQLLILW
jgi:hypothetical protein